MARPRAARRRLPREHGAGRQRPRARDVRQRLRRRSRRRRLPDQAERRPLRRADAGAHGRRFRSRRAKIVGRPPAALLGHADAPRALSRLPAAAASSTPTRSSRPRSRRRGLPVRCMGTTHADHFRGDVPVTRAADAATRWKASTSATRASSSWSASARRDLAGRGARGARRQPRAVHLGQGRFEAVEHARVLEVRGAHGGRSGCCAPERGSRARGVPGGPALPAQARRPRLLRAGPALVTRAAAACERGPAAPRGGPRPGRGRGRDARARRARSGSAAPTCTGSARAGSARPGSHEPLVLGHEIAGSTEDGRRVAIEPADPVRTCALCREGHPNLCVEIRFAGHGADDGASASGWRGRSARSFALPDALTRRRRRDARAARRGASRRGSGARADRRERRRLRLRTDRTAHRCRQLASPARRRSSRRTSATARTGWTPRGARAHASFAAERQRGACDPRMRSGGGVDVAIEAGGENGCGRRGGRCRSSGRARGARGHPGRGAHLASRPRPPAARASPSSSCAADEAHLPARNRARGGRQRRPPLCGHAPLPARARGRGVRGGRAPGGAEGPRRALTRPGSRQGRGDAATSPVTAVFTCSASITKPAASSAARRRSSTSSRSR